MLKEIIHILKNDCPNCYKAKVFKDKNFYFSIGFPKMNKSCSNCGYVFEKEPGYFFGAMYINYGITVGESIVTYAIGHQFFDETFDVRILPLIAIVITLLSFLNIRLSRMIWIYMFKDYSL